MPDRYWDREREERGRRYQGEGYYGGYYDTPDRDREWNRRGDDRGFFDRAGDEVRSWFGDEDAQRRRTRDEREERGRWGESRGGGGERGWRPARERGWGDDRRGGEDVDRDWARQWGYLEGRGGSREPERGWPRGWGYSGGYGAGAGYMGGRSDWSGSGGYEPGAGGMYGNQPRREHESERAGAGWRSGLWHGPHVGRGPRGYQRSDERIREDVCERMCEHGELDASEIEIVVASGEVTLKGTVSDRSDKRLAEDLTAQVSGVRDVNNQIRVSQGTTGQESQPQRPDSPRYRAA